MPRPRACVEALAFDHEGTLLARGTQFASELLIVDVPIPPVYRKRLLDVLKDIKSYVDDGFKRLERAVNAM